MNDRETRRSEWARGRIDLGTAERAQVDEMYKSLFGDTLPEDPFHLTPAEQAEVDAQDAAYCGS